MSQKALLLPAKAAPWVVGEVPIPEPGPKQVLVKIEAAALNPADWKVQKHYGDFVAKYPTVLGWDGAGVVEKLGAEVTSLKKGDRVLFEDASTFQQYLAVDADLAVPVPKNISIEQAASVPLGFLTVALALYSAGSAAFTPFWEEAGASAFKNKPALILGGASSVGQNAIQLARLAGHSPIITTASPHNAALLTSLGATHVVPRALPQADILARLAEITAGAPIPYVYDSVSDEDTIALGFAALAPTGTLVIVFPGSPFLKEAHADGKRVVSIFASVADPNLRPLAVELYKRLPGWLESGAVKPNPVEVLSGGLGGIPAGLERMEAGKVSGTKLIVRPHDTA